MEHWQFYVQGRLLELFNRRDAAIAAYRAVLERKPDFHGATNRIAYLLASMGRFADAEPHFKEVLRQEPGSRSRAFQSWLYL